MNIKTSKKILKVAGTLTLIGAIITIAMAVFSMVLGGVGATMPEVNTDKEFGDGVAFLLVYGFFEVISGVISLIEGVVSRRAAKDGKHATAALVFAVLSMISSISSSIDLVKKEGMTVPNIIAVVIGVALSLLIMLAAFAVRKDAKERGAI